MALAEYTHHASRGQTRARAREEAGSETYHAPRGPKTLPPGLRPAPPSEVAGPQGSAATGGYVAAGAPLLAVSSLRGADGVDDTAVKFLLRAELRKKKKEEEEKEREQARKLKEAQDKADLELAKRDPWWAQHLADMKAMELRNKASSSSKRKRKKRRKRRTPRTSSLPGRARRRHRQRHVPVSLFDRWSMSLLCSACSFHRCNDEICADNFYFPWFKLEGKGLCEQWEVFLYGDKIIKVDRDTSVVLPRGVPPSGIGGVGFGSSPFLDTKHTIYELCLPSERVFVAMSCGGGFSPDGAYGSMGQRDADDWKYSFDYFQYQRDVECVCMLNHWFSSIDEICADNYFFPVQVEGQVSQ